MSRSELRYLRSLLTPPLWTRHIVLYGALFGVIIACVIIPWAITHSPLRSALVSPRTSSATPHTAPTGNTSITDKATQNTSNPQSTGDTNSAPSTTNTPPMQLAPASSLAHIDLTEPHKKDIAMQLVSSAENSSLNWRAQYSYIEDIGDGRGYTGGIIGFTSGTGDMLDVVQRYAALRPGNVLAPYIPALQSVNGTDSHTGLGSGFVSAWKAAASDPAFQTAQNDERDTTYFNPAVSQAKADGLRALGQSIYYDALVMHGPGDDPLSFGGIRAAALAHARMPAQGGDEATYLNAFLDARKAAMLADPSHQETDRVDTEQRPFLNAGNFDLNTPLRWLMYGDTYTIAK